MYKKQDVLMESLILEMAPGDSVKVGKRTVTLINNFADTNKVFRAHGISKFEFKVSDG